MADLNTWATVLVAEVGGALSGLSSKVDASVRGLSWKQAARAASISSIIRSTPGSVMDGVTLSAGDRVLLKNQTVTSENGIYVWNGPSAPLARSTDADSSDELTGAAVTITAGVTNAGTVWVQSTPAPILGSTSITWAPVGGGQPITASTYVPTIEG